MNRYPARLADVSAIVPLPRWIVDNAATAFTPILGEPVIVRLVRGMVDAVSDCTVAAAEPLVHLARKAFAAHDLPVPVVAAEDPAARAQCLAAGLARLTRSASPPRHVLIFDIRRPLVSGDVLNRVVTALRAGGAAVVPASPPTDSVKVVDARGSVTATVDRSTLAVVQYPRGFAVEQLARMLQNRRFGEFDELSEVRHNDVPLTVVDGQPEASAVELPHDTEYLEAVIQCRTPPGW